jgi:hypothetical protein
MPGQYLNAKVRLIEVKAKSFDQLGELGYKTSVIAKQFQRLVKYAETNL